MSAAVIAAAINAKFSAPQVISLVQAKSATKDYINVFTARRFVPDRRESGEVTVPGGRTIIRLATKSETNLANYRSKVFAALEDQILTDDVGPFVFESEDFVDPDEVAGSDWYLADITFTY